MSDYNKTISEAREAVLRDDLSVMRKMIRDYSLDTGELPQSLDDLVKAGYLHEIPEDPITEKKDWKIVIGEHPNHKERKGIVDIRSSSSAKSSGGEPYNEW